MRTWRTASVIVLVLYCIPFSAKDRVKLVICKEQLVQRTKTILLIVLLFIFYRVSGIQKHFFQGEKELFIPKPNALLYTLS
jgi:hypothetical protein